MTVAFNVLSDALFGWVTQVHGRIGHYLRYDYYKRRLASIGDHVIIDQGVIIVSPERVHIGNHTWIDKNTIILGEGGVTIGNYVHVSQNCLLQGVGGLHIEDYAGISAGCHILSGADDLFSGKPSNPTIPKKYRTNVVKKTVYIHKHALIGVNSVVLLASIGEGAIVGALSLANKDVPAWSVVVGSPAKPLKIDGHVKRRKKIMQKSYCQECSAPIPHNVLLGICYTCQKVLCEKCGKIHRNKGHHAFARGMETRPKIEG